jgi:assimilatory nitrate reductase catalytic subunit
MSGEKASPPHEPGTQASLLEASGATPPPGPVHETRSTCCYCGVGCGVIIESTLGDDGRLRISSVRGDPEHPANFGRLCSKGSTLAQTAAPEIARQSRGDVPMIRHQRGSPWVASSWSDAMDFASARFLDILSRFGPDSVALYISGQLLTEDYYLFNKLAKALLGTNNIDTNSRLCMSSAVSGYKKSLGADSVPACYEDLDHAGTVFIVGANPAFAHPVLYQRLRQARQANPSLVVIVVDPRRTDSADEADLFLQILPGSDVWLFHAMLKLMQEEDLTDSGFIAQHTSGFRELHEVIASLELDTALAQCGLDRETVTRAARAFALGPTLSLWCQGLNQSASGTDKNTALINLHLASGQIGKPGAGPLSLTGQPNAMGGREVGGMANLLPAHRELSNPIDRDAIARFWGVPAIPSEPGKTAVEMFEAIEAGTIRAVWIVCTNPAHSLPDQRAIHRALAKAELVILQDAYHDTATAPAADVFFPATSWGEKEGTVTNSDRTISRVRAAQPGYGQSRHDWAIALEFARRLETVLRPGAATLFPYTDAESIWLEHRATTAGRDLDISGLDYAILERDGPQQWPYPRGASHGQKRLYEDHVFATPDGRARFCAPLPRAMADPPDRRYPMTLTSGRLRDQWHGMSRTGTLARAFAHAPRPCIDLCTADAHELGVVAGELVRVTGRRASQLLPAQISAAQRPGQAFVAMHWSDAYVSGRARDGWTHGPNDFFARAIDPVSKQPELKNASIRIMKAELPWQWHAAVLLEPGSALAVQQRLRQYFKEFSYAHCVPFGHERIGLEWRAEDDYAPKEDIQAAIEALLGMGAEVGLLRYADAKRGQRRLVRLEEGRVTGFSLAGEAAAEIWLRQLLESGEEISFPKRRLLAPGANPPGQVAPRSRILCNCAAVEQTRITDRIQSLISALPAAERAPARAATRAPVILECLKSELGCGAQCGSCVPELRRLVREAQHASV